MAFSAQTLSIVIGALSVALVYKCIASWKQSRIDAQFAAERGCQPLKSWTAKWPLGLDLLVRAFRYDKRKQILRLFTEVCTESGTTFEQNLLFARGVNTIDPENIEAVLSSQFTDFNLGLRPVHFDPLMGSGIFTQDGTQ
ncbi:n-alkane-inducible cytochrome P450 [Penicillium canescens]|nr:n-alkane-inducible cytochrome P450 [Penicillium canescens]